MRQEKCLKICRIMFFPFIKGLGNNKNSNYSKYMQDAIFLIPTPLMLQKVVTAIDSLPMKDRDTKGMFMNIYFQNYLQQEQMGNLEHQDIL